MKRFPAFLLALVLLSLCLCLSACAEDALEFIMAGAEAVQVGTATFSNPFAMKEIVEGLEAFMKRKGYKTIGDFRGIAQSGAQNR